MQKPDLKMSMKASQFLTQTLFLLFFSLMHMPVQLRTRPQWRNYDQTEGAITHFQHHQVRYRILRTIRRSGL